MRLVLVLGAQQRIDAALERQGLAPRYAGGCASARPPVPAPACAWAWLSLAAAWAGTA